MSALKTICRQTKHFYSEVSKKKVVVSGIQPTGNLHIGNYLGSIKNWLNLQNNEYERYYFIADLHALSDIFSATERVKEHKLQVKDFTKHLMAILIASGLDPEKSNIFVQSDIPMHSELCWILNCVTPLHYLNKMTQFKSKKTQGSTSALYTYPILMAADILLYKADLVPVGNDQVQHLEITRDLAVKFNKTVGKRIMNQPKPLITDCKRIMSLHDADSKMSKSDNFDKNRVNLLDSSETIHNKIMKAKTDSIFEITDDPARKEIVNLVNIYSGFANLTPDQVFERYNGKKIKKFKEDLIEIMINELVHIKDEYNKLIRDEDYLAELIERGKLNVLEEAYKNLNEYKNSLLL